MTIPFSKVTLGDEESEAVLRVLSSGWLAAGKEVEAFEREFADYITPPKDGKFKTWKEQPYYCIFTNSGTSALKMAYKWAKEQGVHSINYPKNTFCATYSAAGEMGLLHYSRNGIYTGERVNMHYGGIKDETPCWLEDSAHRIEANDPLVGKVRIYSFYATKNMTTGSGGMLVTNDKDIYERCRLYWRDGLTATTLDRAGGKYDYNVEVMAGGYDGNDIAAAIGRAQLKKLPLFSTRRNQIRERYNRGFGNQSWAGNHLYPYFVDRAEDIGSLIGFLKERGIGTGYHYPGTGWLGVSLPIYPLLTDKEQDYIIAAVKEWKACQNV